jgi:hypothetical protein
MPKLTTKYSILALNLVSRQKMAVYRYKKRFTDGFRLLRFFFNFFRFGTNFGKKKPGG